MIGHWSYTIKSEELHHVTVLIDQGSLVTGSYVIDLSGSSATVENRGAVHADNWAVSSPATASS